MRSATSSCASPRRAGSSAWQRPSAARAAAAARATLADAHLSPIEQVQVFGRKDSRETQKALRFFRERRIGVVFVDLAVKAMAPAELRRFSDRVRPWNLVDEQSRAYRDAGLGYMRLGHAEMFERLLADQRLLRLPLVRAGTQVSVGVDESAWKSWLS